MAEKTITILSIDGGGVRGIIPGVFLRVLEAELQILENDPNARVADYFDIISGTSTGGLISTMISAADEQRRPLFAANEIEKFYIDNCPHIFPRSSDRNEPEKVEEESGTDEKLIEETGSLKKPIYDGTYLHNLAREILKERRLHETLTKVVIPAYDVKKMTPVVFSSYEVDHGNRKLDALLSDICISTSAAPVYLPAYLFNNEGEEFNMIDGGVAANNPTLVAITEAVKKRSAEIDEDAKMDLNSYRLLVLSLGTCENKSEKYNVGLVNSFWAINWLIYPLRTFWKADHPILEILFDANADMIDYYCTMFFDSFRQPENFLRIQDDKLPKDLAALDNGSKENLLKLQKYAEELLKKPVTRLSPTFERSVIDTAETYGEALKKFAKKLYDIKHGF